MKQKPLVLFSIITSLLSMAIGLVQRFIVSLDDVDIMVIFFSGMFILIVVLFLLYFLGREIVINSYKKKELELEEAKEKRKRLAMRRKRAEQKGKK